MPSPSETAFNNLDREEMNVQASVAMDKCPHCLSDICEEALYCARCTRIVKEFTACCFCHEPISIKAAYCSYCTNKLPIKDDLAVRSLDLEIRATRLGSLLCGSFTGLFLPPILRVHEGKITVKKWEFLGLRFKVQEIQVSRVASVHYTKGIFWGGIIIESFAGEGMAENGLVQNDAKMMADKLKSVLTDGL